MFASDASSEAIPGSFVVGMANGGDLTSAARSAVEMMGYGFKKSVDIVQRVKETVVNALELSTQASRRWTEYYYIQPRQKQMEVRQMIYDLTQQVGATHAHLWTINEAFRQREDARARYRGLVAKGDRIQNERSIFRKRSSAAVSYTHLTLPTKA